MVIYLRHPDHGTKVAIAEAEAIYDEKHGWERFDVNSPELDTIVVNVLAKPRGRTRKEIPA
jgi:hypothetical protein